MPFLTGTQIHQLYMLAKGSRIKSKPRAIVASTNARAKIGIIIHSFFKPLNQLFDSSIKLLICIMMYISATHAAGFTKGTDKI